MREVRAFIDTNVLVYLYADTDDRKREIARDWIGRHISLVSTQVLTEFCGVCTRRFHIDTDLLDEKLALICSQLCFRCDVTEHDLHAAIAYHKRCGYSYYDSLVISSAVRHRCRYLFTEDMCDGHMIDGVEIVNIFDREGSR